MFRRNLLSMVLLCVILLGQAVSPALAAACDQAQFVSDITVPDGATYAPGASFTKTWRFSNAGTCTWTTSYKIMFAGGDAMGPNVSVNLPVSVPPGQMLDISVNLTAPSTPGHFKGLWKFVNPSGTQFGIGDSGDDAFWVDINVVAVEAVIYDFVANAPYAQWKSGAGALPYPGTSGDRRGFAYKVDQPHLEDDSFDSMPGLLTVPQNKYNGYIQATYPEFLVQKGDKLQTLVNCEFGATGCYVTFRIDYMLPNGAQLKLWQWKESYDKRFYRADIDLSPLAGQRVRFVFMLLASGYATYDRALWGAPRILRTGTIQPPAPPATLTPLPPLPQTPTAVTFPTVVSSGCDRATFVTDVNIPDGTIYTPGAAFSKTWRLMNSGTCTWTTDYRIVFAGGELMGASPGINMPFTVYPGQTADLTVNMVAPVSPGNYRGYWMLMNSSGAPFGIGPEAANPFWVDIKVAADTSADTGYDFTANACSAQWKSGAGYLPCPGTDNDRNGFVLVQNSSTFEDGSSVPSGLLTFPQYRYNGYIQGFYPAFTVQPGDRFQTSVGCENGSSCYVTFMLQYMNPNGYIGNFWTWREYNDQKIKNVDLDLKPLAGRSVRFILTLLATGYAANDRALWGAPRIYREGANPPTPSASPLPPTSTLTATPSTTDWLTYSSPTYGFEFKYPPQSQIADQQTNFVRINLPFASGTNLREKYLATTVIENADACQSPFTAGNVPPVNETVLINGVAFLKQAASEGAAGNQYNWVGYSTYKGNNCISVGFMLHSLGAGAFDPPVPEFDQAAESVVFDQIMQTLTWTDDLTPTSTPVTTPSDTATAVSTAETTAVSPSPSPTFLPSLTATPSVSPSPSAIPTVSSLNAKVTADKLSCRYGPGVEYLYLYALNINANIKLIGRTDANNWVRVDGVNKCWVNKNYLNITGDPNTLPIVYPGLVKLPVSPYYPGPAWASAYRNGNSVGVEWQPVPISPGKFEDEFMHQYILEVWRCEAGKIIFETLGTNSPFIVVANDEPGCSTPSHGRVFVQEKHGYGGPVEVPWP